MLCEDAEYGGAVGPEHAFESGPGRVPDGVEVLIRSRAGSA
ncbi:hypothetical protein Acsp04_10230 [Actinomadura sp. NBRC 104425]|nr:hypothetical protein [Actinomadura sp. NBRC 104425]GLZ10788.1 hypothetical protein Acsp04_10230 [Actinomadura sp. NBRC 104425]